MRKQSFELIVADLLRDCTVDRATPAQAIAPVPQIACAPSASHPIDLVEFFGSLSQDESGHWGRVLTSTQAAHIISGHYGLDYSDVKRTMIEMSQSLWCLLDSAEGWTVLGEQIALAVRGRLDGPILKASVH